MREKKNTLLTSKMTQKRQYIIYMKVLNQINSEFNNYDTFVIHKRL